MTCHYFTKQYSFASPKRYCPVSPNPFALLGEASDKTSTNGHLSTTTSTSHLGRPQRAILSASSAEDPRMDEHLIVPVTISFGRTSETTFAMVDHGSQSNLIDYAYAKALRIPLIERTVPIPIQGFDGQLSTRSLKYYTRAIELHVGEHSELIEFNVGDIAHYPIILGIPWIRTHDVIASLGSNTVTFPSDYCATHCLPATNKVDALDLHPRLADIDSMFPATSTVAGLQLPASTSTTLKPPPAITTPTQPSALESTVQPKVSTSVNNPGATTDHCSKSGPPAQTGLTTPKVALVSSSAFHLSVKRGLPVYAIRTNDLYSNSNNIKSAAVTSSATSTSTDPFNVENEWDTTQNLESVLKELPPQYHDYADVFDKAKADSLPERRACDHQIPIEEGKTIPPSKIFPLSATELDALRNYLEENLKRGFIRPSTSPVGSMILFVKKKDGLLRLCVDY